MNQPVARTARDTFAVGHPKSSTFNFDEFVIDETDDGEVFDDLTVFIDYQPAERMTRDYPGCPADLEVVGIFGKDGSEITLSDEYHDALVASLWEEIYARESDRLESCEDY